MSAKDICRCGAAMGSRAHGRFGCDDCEKAALERWHAERQTPELPPNWWRKFEPQWSCGPYYLFGRSDLTGREEHPPNGRGFLLKDCELITACENGVSIESPWPSYETDTKVRFQLDHMTSDDAKGLEGALAVARVDHDALRLLMRNDDELAKFVKVVARERRTK